MMGVQKIRQYLPALLWYLASRRGSRGGVIAVRVCGVCGMDRRCGIAVYTVMTRLAEKGLARRHKQGVYLIERAALEEVIAALREWI
jgi:predicted transcriptional regulator of viral defense system